MTKRRTARGLVRRFPFAAARFQRGNTLAPIKN
jgi:hypothetical protein